MEASVRKKQLFDDPRWIIGTILGFMSLLLTLIVLIATLSAKVSILSDNWDKCNIKVERVYQEYVPVEQFVNVIDLLQTEKQELVGIARHDSVVVRKSMDKYHSLIIQWEKDMRVTRGGGSSNNEKMIK
jgi:hypothetical protein